MKYKDLEEKVLNYADDNNFLSSKNLITQSIRLNSTVLELGTAISKKSEGFKEFIIYNKIAKTEEEINKGLGKALYNLIILAEINGLSLENCLTEYFKNKK